MWMHRTALCCAACVIASILMPAGVRAGDPVQFYNEHASEKPNTLTAPAATNAATIKKAIVADFKAGRFESAFSGIARLNLPTASAGNVKTWITSFQEQQYRPWAAQRRREFEQQVKQDQSLIDRR